MTDLWEVFALKYADHNIRPRSDSFLYDDNHDAQWPLDYFIWVLKNNGRYILVDTGFDAQECQRRGRTMHEEPAVLLTRFGVKPDMIDNVIITHLHYDHAGSINEFMHATFHVQEAEMQYATGPCMCHDVLRKPFTADHVCNMIRQLYDGKVHFHNGSSQIAPGVEVHLIGGHSRGLQCVRVKT
ncbi:MAG: N-acyl homoserine lactonase family protein, partial [Pseudomonadota bacterium]